jgi:signal transduction histidine kinase
MNSSPAPDLSLYELASQIDPAPLIVQTSPATLKSVVNSFVNLLVEQQLPSIVWVKLPRGEAWQAELERLTAAGTGTSQRTIYLFKAQRDEATEDPTLGSTMLSPDSDRQFSSSATPADQVGQAPVFSVSLALESQIRREYFLVVWSANFQGMILAHRPRSSQSGRSTGVPETDTEQGQAEENQEKRQVLLTICSFDTRLIQQVLQGIEQATLATQTQQAMQSGAAVPAETGNPVELINQWKSLITELPIGDPDMLSANHLFMQQLQRQEEIWQRGSAYRRQAELAESLQLQTEELTTALRLKDEFLNNLAQELRTPLTTIKTALTLLNSPSIKQPQRQRYMDLIAKECDRQNSLVNSLLEIVQIDQSLEQSTLQAIRLADVVPAVVSTYQPVAEEKGIRLAYTIPEGLPPVSGMATWLRQIVINLLNNGIRFTSQGGQVWVRAKQQGEYVQIEFRDTGIGIPANEIPKIFDRFYRVRTVGDESTGAGLGLTIVQQLLLHCGGSISVKSKVGEGTTFTVLLPVHPSHSEDSGMVG